MSLYHLPSMARTVPVKRVLRIWCPRCKTAREVLVDQDRSLSPIAKPINRSVHITCNACLAKWYGVSVEKLQEIERQ